jgi:hypothetical protein
MGPAFQHIALIADPALLRSASGVRINLTLWVARKGLDHSSSLHDYFRFKLKPFLQRRDATERLRIEFPWNRHPIDGYAICQTVDAHTLMRVPDHFWSLFPKPQDSSSRGFILSDEATRPSGSLKCLEFLHGPFLACLIAILLLRRSEKCIREKQPPPTPEPLLGKPFLSRLEAQMPKRCPR